MSVPLTPVALEAALRAGGAFRPLPPAADRAAWNAIHAALDPGEADAWLARAEAAAAAPLQPLTATAYLNTAYGAAQEARRAALVALTVAACLQGGSRFLGPLLDCAWAICEESAWAWPDPAGGLPDPAAPHLDARAAATALALAELDALLGADLPPALAARINAEVEQRVIEPFLHRHSFAWMFSPGHEAAACVAGVVGAALYLEAGPARLAEIVARGLWALGDGLQRFDLRGWAQGLAAWALLAHLLAARTGGRLDLLADSAGLARLPLLARLGPNAYAGCVTGDQPTAALLAWLAQRFDQPQLARLAHEQRAAPPPPDLPWALRSLLWRPDPEAAVPPELPARDWDERLGCMTVRFDPADPAALALAVLGGRGAAVCCGGDLLIADVPPPLAADHAAHPAAAAALERQSTAAFDFVSLELKDAYPPAAGLLSLRRVVALHRSPPGGWVELVDGVLFDGEAHTLQTALVTPAGAALTPGVVILNGPRAALRVEYYAEQVYARLEMAGDLSRVVFTLRQPSRSGAIRLKIEPVT